MSRWLVPALLGATLAACSMPPPVQPPHTSVTVPPTWTGAADTARVAPTDDWWTAFESAELDSAVLEALQRNRELGTAVANVQAARASATIAGADRWPQLDATARGARTKQIFVGLPIPGGEIRESLSTSYALSLGTSWEIDLWNRLGEQQKAALAELQATEADLAAARLSVAALAAQGWLELTELRVQESLAERTVAAFRRTEELATDRYRRGLIPAVDVHLTRTSAEDAAALLALRRNQVQQASRHLEILLGRYPAGRLRGAETLPSSVPGVPSALPAELLVRRPDLLAAERRLVASGARVSAARRNLLPRIALTGSTGTTSNELEDLLDGDFSVWSIAGGLVQPLFQGGRLRAQVSLNAAREDAALSRYVQAALQAFGEVERSLAAEAHLETREAHLREALASADRAWRLAEDRYRQGIGNLLDVLEAQRRTLSAESQLITVRAQRLRTRVDLHRALGGGFDASVPVPDFLAPSADASLVSGSE